MGLDLWSQEEVIMFVRLLIGYGNQSIVSQCVDHPCIPKEMIPLALRTIGIPVQIMKGGFKYIPDMRFLDNCSLREEHEKPEYTQLFTGHVVL